MTARGFSQAGLSRLHETMTAHVEAGDVPGLVLAVQRGDELHVDAIGSAAFGAPEPVGADALFRITSMTKPVTALATLVLADQGRLGLDDPVETFLPELGGRRVLRHLNGPVDDTVAATGPVTVRDLLTFRAGFGMILFPPSEYPILHAEESLALRSLGPPVPATRHDPHEWIRRMGTLPLMDQPGGQWRYGTGSHILGVLIARLAGQSLESFYREHIFAPLKMHDTAFSVPATDLHRLATCYQPKDGAVVPYDDEGFGTHPPVFPDGGAGLVSTVGDYMAFARMLAAGGAYDGGRIVAPDLVTQMTADHLTPEQRAGAGPILGGRGWGFGLAINDVADGDGAGPTGYGWSGGFGTVWANDPQEDLSAILMTQVLAFPGSSTVETDFWSGVHRALG